jgi:prevent-host-death family protein
MVMVMIEIRPVSDLRYKFSEIEKQVQSGQPVYLTKNGYGAMVVMSIESYSRLTDPVERALDEADLAARTDDRRMNHKEVFDKLRSRHQDK